MYSLCDIKCEGRACPLGIDEEQPRFSWRTDGDTQKAYRITVYDENGRVAWDSGMSETSDSVLVGYAGAQLRPKTRYAVRLFSESVHGEQAEKDTWFETGVLGTGIKGTFITTDRQNTVYLRRTFTCARRVVRARMYASALGVYQLTVNGNDAGGELLCPGWTSYKNRLQYQTCDVTEKLRSGENALGVKMSEGWVSGDIITLHDNKKTHVPAKFICELDIAYEDGTCETVVSDADWKYAPACPLCMSDYYQGNHYDARLEMPGWDAPGFDDGDWPGVLVSDESRNLVGQHDQPVRRICELRPERLFTTPCGEKVIDFGQNMVGFVHFRVTGKAGDEAIISHAEVLDKNGNFYTENYRAARAELRYTLRDGAQEFEPMLTFYGFRYIRIDKWPCELRADDFKGVVISSDIEVTSGFECSDNDVNRLFKNIQWGQRGNFVDVPTDCPQRDERLGWTGDCQVFARTACINMDSGLMLSEWCRDLAYDQRADGAVPFVVPDCLVNGYGSAAWGDAATVVPWTVYQCFGDRRVLQNQYHSMRRWLDFMASQSENFLWSKGWHFGDWLGLDAQDGSYVGATDKTLIATAFWAYSAEITGKTAEVLGYDDEADELAKLAENVRQAYRREYITPNGRLAVETQTAYVLTLYFRLCEEKDRQRLINDFKALLSKSNNHLTTGFVGTPYLCPVLSDCGLHELAGQLFMNRNYPSWLYPVSKGATTMWEHWDGIKPDGSFWSRDMNSYNHYAYGAIGEWMFRYLAGIDLTSPGYRTLRLKPMPIDQLEYVSAWQNTPYGKVESAWKRNEDGTYNVSCRVPYGSKAELCLNSDTQTLEPGTYVFESVKL